MTILKERNTLFVPELKIRFKVISVDWEPHAESDWHLQYQDSTQFFAYDKLFVTREEDEQLVDKEIEVHICVSAEEGQITSKKEKNFSYKDGWVEVTGIVEDDIKSYSKDKYNGIHEEYVSYKLNSVFPLEISDLPEGAKIGNWVTVRGEAIINFPEKR